MIRNETTNSEQCVVMLIRPRIPGESGRDVMVSAGER